MAIDKEQLGKAIRRIRMMRGISQSSLAKQAGLQGNSVALIERGERGVSLDSLNALSDALDIPAACLAMLGTTNIAGDRGSAALVKSLQRLIVATVSGEEQLVKGTRKARSPRKRPTARRPSKRLEPA